MPTQDHKKLPFRPLNGDKNGSRPVRPGNMPPRMNGAQPPNHRPSRSQEEELRTRNGNAPPRKPTRPTGELDIFADPSMGGGRSENRRPRRNSESSVADRSSKLLDPEDEKRRQE